MKYEFFADVYLSHIYFITRRYMLIVIYVDKYCDRYLDIYKLKKICKSKFVRNHTFVLT